MTSEVKEEMDVEEEMEDGDLIEITEETIKESSELP